MLSLIRHVSITVCLSLCALTPRAWAWNSTGHMAVACVAWHHLDTVHKARAIELLKLNPYSGKWSAYADALHLTGDERDMAIFMYAATWPDEIRGDSFYSGPFVRPLGTPVPENPIGYTDKELHLYWHFINKPYSPDNSATEPAPAPNAATQIPLFRSDIAEAETPELESYELVWLEHMVGDLHQPLHAIERVVAGEGDRGATRLKLNGHPDNLHGFWDDLAGPSDPAHPENDFRTAVAFVSTLQPSPKSLVNITDVETWVNEGYSMGKQDVYHAPIGPGLGPYTLTAAYRTRALKDGRVRIELGGERLARLIESNLR